MGQFLPTFKKKWSKWSKKWSKITFMHYFLSENPVLWDKRPLLKKKVGKKCPIDFGLKSEKIKGVVELTTPLIIPLNTLSQELNEQPNQP